MGDLETTVEVAVVADKLLLVTVTTTKDPVTPTIPSETNRVLAPQRLLATITKDTVVVDVEVVAVEAEIVKTVTIATTTAMITKMADTVVEIAEEVRAVVVEIDAVAEMVVTIAKLLLMDTTTTPVGIEDVVDAEEVVAEAVEVKAAARISKILTPHQPRVSEEVHLQVPRCA